MTESHDPMAVVAAPPPDLDESTVVAMLVAEYGLEGRLDPLVSERDQNFRLDAADGRRYVVKIANVEELPQTTDFQVQVLLHLERAECEVPVPRVIPTRSGAVTVEVGDQGYVMRVVTFLPGTPVEGIGYSNALAFELGRCLATLDAALEGFSHPGQSQSLMWDMQQALQLRDILEHVDDAALRASLDRSLDDFERRALPAFPSCRQQVIHNDLNLENVLVADAGSDVVTGVIDFGDMLRAPLVVDAAIAASYLRDDHLVALREFFRGFESRTPLHPDEKRLVYDLIRTRLSATLAILSWRAAARAADDPYLNKVSDERDAVRFLRRLDDLGKAGFEQVVFGI